MSTVDSYIAEEVLAERHRQDVRWGEQNHRDGTGGEQYVDMAYKAKESCDAATAYGDLTWADILLEEVTEALAETNTARIREELVQVAAVAQAWIAAIDRRGGH